MTTNNSDMDHDADDGIVLVNEKPLNWFDVSAIGTGEMLGTLGWGWIAFIGASFGTKWTLIGFAEGALVVTAAWWLYREMITAVPEPGTFQSYGREAGMFSLGTAYFLLWVPVYGVFMWLELLVAQGLFHLLIPSVPQWIWPYVTLLPVMALNLMGHQITGKVQALLVVFTLVGDIALGVFIWVMLADHRIWALNWPSPGPIGWLTPFSVAGMWLAIMVGVLEVQQVLVDEWDNFPRSRDVGLLTAAYGLWVRQIPLALALFASLPLVALSAMSVPTVELVQTKLGQHPLLYLAIVAMLIATYTTLSVYFMAMPRILALYTQQGALPRMFAKYSSRSVPWVAILFLGAFALGGVYITESAFVVSMMSCFSGTFYFMIALFFLRMRRSKTLERPLVAKYGVPIAVVILIFSALIAVSSFISNWRAAMCWIGAVVLVLLYDQFIVPNTERGRHYRAQVLRKRTSAARL
jgi:amino acid transporter